MTVPPTRQCTLPDCEREAVDPTKQVGLCDRHLSSISSPGERSTDSVNDTPESDAEIPDSDHANWTNADFTNPESGVWPIELLEREQWMGHKPNEKQP